MRPALIIGGVCLTGKTTLAHVIQKQANFRVEVIEGDELHTAVAIAKMRAGLPLNEDDREAWRSRIGVRIAQRPSDRLRVITCSALTRFTRDTLRSHGDCQFVFLTIPRALAELRATYRLMAEDEHFFQPAKYASLLDGQYRDLQIPNETETDCQVFDAEAIDADTIASLCLQDLRSD
ncbi:gluconokinase [Cerasicoccus arenae]|uniref:gluconokinase n=1 Tax=Cerasicoccus arenae TaxID=424488 RepID=A0A8J3GEE7_9BACT|nr:gluconokinase [Cerasicoccus arenae]MBK1859542.1 hypothetical protein [Cerasicoccus arenae]GHC03246.1 gluconokinase [Cerasicoccus arenae]